MDGVLADTEPMHGECFIRAFETVGIRTTLADYRSAVTIGGSPVKDFFFALGGSRAEWEAVLPLKHANFRKLVAEKCEPMPGVIELLTTLRQAGIRTAVATSAREISLSIVLDKLGIRSYFDEFVTKRDVKLEKPDPEGYLIATRRLGLKPEDCVAMEDSPRGVLAAYRAGMKCVAIPTPSTADGDFTHATLIVKSLEDVTIETLRGLF